jgi:hypothetical protein
LVPCAASADIHRIPDGLKARVDLSGVFGNGKLRLVGVYTSRILKGEKPAPCTALARLE